MISLTDALLAQESVTIYFSSDEMSAEDSLDERNFE